MKSPEEISAEVKFIEKLAMDLETACRWFQSPNWTEGSFPDHTLKQARKYLRIKYVLGDVGIRFCGPGLFPAYFLELFHPNELPLCSGQDFSRYFNAAKKLIGVAN